MVLVVYRRAGSEAKPKAQKERSGISASQPSRQPVATTAVCSTVSYLMRSPQEDLALVARCKRELPRRHDAFEELIRAYQSKIYTLCYRLTGNSADAEDLLQDVLLRLFVSITSFDGRSSFSTWLYRVVHNHCLNAIAKKKRSFGRNEEMLLEPVDPRSLSVPRQGRAQWALDQLSEGDRTLLVMKYITELEIQEIATILGLGTGAVKMRLLRARELFRNKYKESL